MTFQQPPDAPVPASPECARAEEALFSLQEAAHCGLKQDAAWMTEQAWLDAHLSACAACHAHQRSLALLTASLVELPPVSPPAQLTDNILGKLAGEFALPAASETATVTPIARARKPWWPQAAPIAAAALLAAVVIPALFQTLAPHAVSVQSPMTTAAALNPPAGQPGFVQLRTASVPVAEETPVDASAIASAQPVNASQHFRHTYASDTENDVYYDPTSSLVGF